MAEPDSTCSIDGCNGPVVARSLCNKHYIRFQRHGSPLAAVRELNRSAPKIPEGGRVVKSGRDRNKQIVLTCTRCGSYFHPKHGREETSRYCTLKCMGTLTVEEEKRSLLGRVLIDENGCWIWTGQTDGGYGRLQFRNKYFKASRASYILFKGDIPKGALVCHKCDVPRCINPDHLFLGTQSDNMQDMIRKKRDGARKRRSLSDSQVISIRRDDRVYRKIAEDHGVSVSIVTQVKLRKTYKDVLET